MRKIEFLYFEAEGAGHAAATGIEELDFCSSEAKEGDLVVDAHGSAVMAVAMDDDFFVELRRSVVRSVFDEELTEEEGLVAKFGGTGLVGEQIGEFVAKDGGAGWFENDDGCAGG